MSMWTVEWMVVYVAVLLSANISVLVFLNRWNRRKKNMQQAESGESQP